MKRFLTAALAALLLFSLPACGGTPADDVPEVPDADTQPQEQDTPPEPTPEELAAQEVEDLLASMTLEEKVGQLFFVRVPDAEAVSDVSTYHLGGYILFSRDTADQTADSLIQTIQSYQDAAEADTGIPLLIGVDEEGGTVVRVSSNPHLRASKFPSPQKSYASGGMEAVLAEFPLSAVRVNIPKWMRTLDPSSPVIKEIISAVSALAAPLRKMKDCDCLENLMSDSPTMLPCKAVVRKMGQGAVECELEARPELFFRVLSDEAGCEIDDEYSLMHYVKGLSHAKTEFDKIRQALDDAEEKGYGVVMPREEDMSLETPELFRQGSQYGVKLKASAPSLHIMKVDVETEVRPIVGSEQQSSELVDAMLGDFENDKQAIWDTNIFGRSLSSLVADGINNKLMSVPVDAEQKLRKTLGRIVNEGKGGVICILL